MFGEFSIFIGEAMAQSGEAAPAQGGGFAGLVPLIIIFVIFYFIFIMPQQKKIKKHQQMVAGLKRGDKVITGGGIVAAVTKVTEGANTLEVEIAKGVHVEVLRATITDMHARPTPADSKKTEKK